MLRIQNYTEILGFQEVLWGVAQADIPVNNEFGCQIAYIKYSISANKRVETILDSKADNTVVPR